ncbi:putative hscarg dehydrogenase [Penicillium brasilianum]|uniref:Putative hscarg dehydrogenase n=1 Tax=Penicillium brasilianum TaxID=104259 RepID=A0A1S9RQ71_PENBI|nr:putative hscarg dehydrogenase [Penicillium brasilianum]
MTTNSKKIIAVVGATGTQGSSVARTFLKLSDWSVRCLTRDPTSKKATELSKLGAEVVKADLEDRGSLHQAFNGVHAIFLNTDFWLPYRKALVAGIDPLTSAKKGYDVEVSHGKNAADVAATIPTLERFVYSALGPMKAASGGKYSHSYHWETKAYIAEYIQAQPNLAKKSSFIYIGAYITNPFLYPKFQPESGEFVSIIPAKKETMMPIINTAESTGPFVRALVEDEEAGTKLLAYDDYLSLQQITDVWSNALKKHVNLISMSMEEMNQKIGIPLEILQGPAFISEYGYCAGLENVFEPSQLKKRMQHPSFKDWLKEQDIADLIDLKEENRWDGRVQ